MADVNYPRIEEVTSPNVGTDQAAHYLGRKQTTLRIGAGKGTGPIEPRRMNGRLAWPVAKIRELVGV